MSTLAKPIAEIHLARGEPLGAEQLLQYSPFAEIPPAMLEKFPGAVVRRRFKKGEVICREGEYGSTAFYIVQGRVEVYLATPLAHIKTQKGEHLFAQGVRRWVRRFSTFLTGDREDPRARDLRRRIL